MIRLGIDYGTTHTVVVWHDRGRFPVVPHVAETAVGTVAREVFPSLAVRERDTGRWLYGFEAERALQRPDASQRYDVLRSLKRYLREYAEGRLLGAPEIESGFDPAEVLAGFARALRDSIERSGLFGSGEEFETVLTWPANANGAQRYLTRHAFKQAGFRVRATLNEPTAAAIEFADRWTRGDQAAARRLRAEVAVFDLGGGTFDVSWVRIDGREFTVLEAQGIERLGGDDLDEVLARLFARKLGIDFDALPPFVRNRLLTHARQQKESIAAGSVRSLTLVPEDLGLKGPLVRVAVKEYFGELRPLLAPALDKLETLWQRYAARSAGPAPEALRAIYLVGGSSLLPLVSQMVAERFPQARRILSDKPFTATAMGAAIHATEIVRLHEVLTRTFGVIRLADHGQREVFDPIFRAGARLPRPTDPPLQHVTEYTPRHNIGHLRYLECAAVDKTGAPCEGIRRWSDALFPYDPAIPVGQALRPEQIQSRDDLHEQRIQETYTCDADGVITAQIRRSSDGRVAIYEVFRS